MVSWLQNAKPNGTHPLPVPIPLQIVKDYSFVRPTPTKMITQDPFIVVTHIEYEEEGLSDIDLEAGIRKFGEEVREREDLLMFLPGKAAKKEIWVITAYRSERSFEEKGFVRNLFIEGKNETGIRKWNEDFFELRAGYWSRS